MQKNSRQRLGATAIIALIGICGHATAADADDFSMLTDLETLGFEHDGSRVTEPGGFSLSSNVDYGTGKYGGSETTDTLQIPVIGRYVTGPWAFKLAVPYIRITDSGSPASAARTESGLGDVVTSATYIVYKGKGADPWLVDVAPKIKFGTASRGKGLGTGENDYALQSAIEKTMGKFTASGTAGYKVNGDPPGVNLRNVFYGSLSGSYDFTAQSSAGLVLDQRQRASPTGAFHSKLTASYHHKLAKAWKFKGYVVKGLANGSADWGGGATVTYAFK